MISALMTLIRGKTAVAMASEKRLERAVTENAIAAANTVTECEQTRKAAKRSQAASSQICERIHCETGKK